MRWAACCGIFTLVLVLAVLGIQLRLHSVTIQTCYTYFGTTLTHEMITLDSFGWSISCVWRINGVYILYAQAFAVVFMREGSSTFKLDGDGGWVLRRKDDGTWRRMCWLPYKRRQGGILSHYGDRVFIGAAGGCVTILDFSDAQTEAYAKAVAAMVLRTMLLDS
jgi:hypothetical protein